MTTEEVPRIDGRRILALALPLTFGMAAIIAQLFSFQVVQHKDLRAKSDAMAVITGTLESDRGRIMDIWGSILAMDVIEWSISASPPYVLDVAETARQLDPLLELSEAELVAALSKRASEVSLRKGVSQETCEAIRALRLDGIECEAVTTNEDAGNGTRVPSGATWEVSANPSEVAEPAESAEQIAPLLGQSVRDVSGLLQTRVPWILLETRVPLAMGEAIRDLKLQGIQCELMPLRVYPLRDLAAHLLGFVNANREGYYGLEGHYNERLGPVEGSETYEVGAGGQRLATRAEQHEAGRPGTSLVLALDLNIQYIADEELRKAIEEYGAESGTVIVMQPASGSILAMVSYPGYDPNLYADSEPLSVFDPAVSGAWEPGSVFKLITWAAALDLGAITPTTTFNDTACIEVGGRTMCNWDNVGHGEVTAADALAQSLNVVAAQIATRIGAESFYIYVRRFGFGSLTNIDLASEGPGLVREPGDSDWFPSDLGAHSFGQGLAVTPIQMVTAVAAIANGGLLVQPHVVEQFIVPGEEGEGCQTVRMEPTATRRAISEQAAEQLTEMMVSAVDSFASKAQVPGYSIAGKSSTASIPTPYGYDPSKTIASYVGFAPADDPQFVILVKLDKPTASEWATQTAAPTFKAIAERLFLYLKIPPDSVRLAQGQP